MASSLAFSKKKTKGRMTPWMGLDVEAWKRWR